MRAKSKLEVHIRSEARVCRERVFSKFHKLPLSLSDSREIEP